MALASELGKRVASLTFDECPEESVYWAKVAIMDTLGVTVAGSSEPGPRILLDVLGESSTGSSVIIGMGKRSDALSAAQINGTSAHALDYDDSSNTLFGHPSAPILSATVALAESSGASGEDMIVSYLAGYETIGRVARIATLRHYDRGWHSTATIGIFGVAAACSRLLGLGARETTTALALSASLASGIKSNFGTMAKPFHVGQAARNGLLATLLARRGFTARDTALERHDGFFAAFNDQVEVNVDDAVSDWGEEWDILEPGIAIKRYPCCGSTHAPLDAVLELVHEHDLRVEDVARLETRTNPRSLGHTNRPDPQSELDAKFSVQYCVARAVVDRRIGFEHFEGDSYNDPQVRELMSRVVAIPKEGSEAGSNVDLSAEVIIETNDGKRLQKSVPMPLGRNPKNPLSKSQLADKFMDCTTRVLKQETSQELYELLQGVERVPDFRQVTRLLEA